MKHTKGPWQPLETMPHPVDGFDGEFWTAIQTSDYIALDLSQKTTKEQAEANARLIATAPELLEALQKLQYSFIHIEGNKKGNQAKTDIIKYNDDVKDALNNARTIITKATQP